MQRQNYKLYANANNLKMCDLYIRLDAKKNWKFIFDFEKKSG